MHARTHALSHTQKYTRTCIMCVSWYFSALGHAVTCTHTLTLMKYAGISSIAACSLKVSSFSHVHRNFIAFNRGCPFRYLSDDSLTAAKSNAGGKVDYVIGHVRFPPSLLHPVALGCALVSTSAHIHTHMNAEICTHLHDAPDTPPPNVRRAKHDSVLCVSLCLYVCVCVPVCFYLCACTLVC